jgi:hypothetical protein
MHTQRGIANKTWCSMACAIREAYAAALTVVVLVDDQSTEYDD